MLYDQLRLSTEFFLYLIPFGFLVSIADYFMVRAFKHSDISKVSPLLAITPVFTLFLGVFFLKEIPTWIGAIGIFLTVLGCYALNFSSYKEGLFTPFITLVTTHGTRYILVTALIYSVTSIILKHLLMISSTITVLLFNSLSIFSSLMMVLMFTEYTFHAKVLKRALLSDLGLFIFLVGSDLLGLIALYSGLALTHTAYVVALKRTAAFFVIIYAYFFLGERKDFKTTFVSTTLIVTGVLMLIY